MFVRQYPGQVEDKAWECIVRLQLCCTLHLAMIKQCLASNTQQSTHTLSTGATGCELPMTHIWIRMGRHNPPPSTHPQIHRTTWKWGQIPHNVLQCTIKEFIWCEHPWLLKPQPTTFKNSQKKSSKTFQLKGSVHASKDPAQKSTAFTTNKLCLMLGDLHKKAPRRQVLQVSLEFGFTPSVSVGAKPAS